MTNEELMTLWEPAARALFPTFRTYQAARHLDNAIGGGHYETWLDSTSVKDKPLPKEVVNLSS